MVRQILDAGGQRPGRAIAAVREGLADSAAGRLIDDEDLDAELDTEFGTLG